MIKSCKGCRNIKEGNFPFEENPYDFDSEKNLKGFFIDQEHQGLKDAEFLKIFYCPVCGRKL